MKLLDKSSINAFKSKERKQEIDEGVKLAGKVDSLRELLSKEEAIIKKFRDETVKIVYKEIDDLIKQRDEQKVITKEIDVLIKQRDELKTEVTESTERLKYLQTLLGKILLINNK